MWKEIKGDEVVLVKMRYLKRKGMTEKLVLKENLILSNG